MKIYFAGSGPLKEDEVIKINKIAKKRLLSYYYMKYEDIHLRIFKLIKRNETAIL